MPRPERINPAEYVNLEPLGMKSLIPHPLGRFFEHTKYYGARALSVTELRRQHIRVPDVAALDRRQINFQATDRFPPSFANKAAEHIPHFLDP